jgi:LuxR family maltose regulon positive regulatory protein
VAWVSLDAGDNDPLRFWRYVMTACQKLLGQERQAAGRIALSLLTAAIHPPFDAPPINMALTHLLNALADPSSSGLLILDDYHMISEARIHEMLAFFIDYLPTTVHVLLLSRAEPELPLLRWRARGELSELHGADLRFSSDETATFLHQTLPVSPSAEALSQIEKSLEGWAAGLRLLSLTLSGWQDLQAIEQALLSLGKRTDFAKPGLTLGADSPRRYLLDYFVSELFETQPEPIQRFLLQTSVLDRLCAPLCDAVTASEGSRAQLEAVARAGLFLEAMVGPGGWYRYHALFAEAMRREASRRLSEETLRVFSLRASYWYEQEALLTEAIDAAWLARDMERVARLIEQFNEQHFYEPYTMLQWLEQLPEVVLREHPALCLLFATELHFPARIRFSSKAIPASALLSLSEAERARVETLLRMAEDGWRRQGEFSWIGAIWAHRALSALLYQDPFSSVVNYAQQALAFLHQKGTLDRRLQMYRSSCLLFVGTEKLRLGQVGEALQMLLQAQEDNVSPGNRFLAVDTHLMLGKSYLIQGELKLAQRYLSQALSEAREVNDDEVIADALLELAWLAFEWKDPETAEQHTHEALEAARRTHPPVQDLHDRAALQLALLQHVRGETLAALEQLTELEARLSMEWTSRSFWLASRLRDWQERLRTATRRTKGTENGSLIEPLSAQEKRVLQLLAAGWSNQDIARELIVSVNTVKYHVKHLYQKLGVSNRLQASEAARHLLTSN